MRETMKCVVCLVLAAVAIALAGCAITGPSGRRYTFEPFEPPGPAVGEKIGEIVLNGQVYCLIDFNGDGVPDFVYDTSSGNWHVVSPANLVPPGSGYNVIPREFQMPNRAGPIGDAPGWEWIDAFIDWDAGFEVAQPFDFGDDTAEEWIASVGLDAPAGSTVVSTALSLELFETDTLHTEVWLLWSSAFDFPDLANYDLTRELYVLSSDDEDSPSCLAFHVAGDVAEVIGLLVDMGGQEFSFDHDGSEWTVVADSETMTATLYQDDRFLMTIDLE